jgi:hypothetical protein
MWTTATSTGRSGASISTIASTCHCRGLIQSLHQSLCDNPRDPHQRAPSRHDNVRQRRESMRRAICSNKNRDLSFCWTSQAREAACLIALFKHVEQDHEIA